MIKMKEIFRKECDVCGKPLTESDVCDDCYNMLMERLDEIHKGKYITLEELRETLGK